MDRRRFLLTSLAGALAAPFAAVAQQAGKVPVIGMLDYGAPDAARLAWWKALREALQELGYVEGRSIAFEARWAEGRVDRLPGLAAELVRLPVNVLVTGGGEAARAAKQATATIPIVTSYTSRTTASIAAPLSTSSSSPLLPRPLLGPVQSGPADSQGSALHDSNRPGRLPNPGDVVPGKVLVKLTRTKRTAKALDGAVWRMRWSWTVTTPSVTATPDGPKARRRPPAPLVALSIDPGPAKKWR
jgi:hypothetical protein